MKHVELLSFDPYEHKNQYNCLGWAMQKITGSYRHEQPDERTDNNFHAAEIAKKYIESNTQSTVEILNHIPSVTELENNQYFIAVRTNSSKDAHFIRSDLEEGKLVWTQKIGYQGPLVKLVDITPEDDEAWYTYEVAPVKENPSIFCLSIEVKKASYVGPTCYLKVTIKPPLCCTLL